MLCWFFVCVFSILFIFCNCVHILLDGRCKIIYLSMILIIICCAVLAVKKIRKKMNVQETAVGGSARGSAVAVKGTVEGLPSASGIFV